MLLELDNIGKETEILDLLTQYALNVGNTEIRELDSRIVLAKFGSGCLYPIAGLIDGRFIGFPDEALGLIDHSLLNDELTALLNQHDNLCRFTVFPGIPVRIVKVIRTKNGLTPLIEIEGLILNATELEYVFGDYTFSENNKSIVTSIALKNASFLGLGRNIPEGDNTLKEWDIPDWKKLLLPGQLNQWKETEFLKIVREGQYRIWEARAGRYGETSPIRILRTIQEELALRSQLIMDHSTLISCDVKRNKQRLRDKNAKST